MAHDFTDLKQRYLAAQLGGNRREALRLVIDEGIGRGASPLEVQLEVIQAAQREIGRLWQESAISIAHEHMATAISNTALAHLYDCSPRAPSNGKKVLVACVDGELHDFPARLVSDALDLAGFEVRYLGASVPADDLLALIDEERPDLLALSVTMEFNLPSLRTTVEKVRTATRGALPIAIGGGCAGGSGIADELRADATGSDASETVAAARRLLGVAAA